MPAPIPTGPPQSRSASINGNGPVSTETMSHVNGTKAGARVCPHIDDLLNVEPGININSPIHKILIEVETLAKQADTHMDFRRPDIALQEHIKASSIVAQIIPRHKDYPSLQSSQSNLHRSYMSLVKRVKGQEEKFNTVIKDIREDNQRTGVLPTKKGQSAAAVNGVVRNGDTGHSRSHSMQSPITSGTSGLNNERTHLPDGNALKNIGLSTSNANGEPARKKPPIHAKPEALHGKVLAAATHGPDTELAARFARLRSLPSQTITQDPRIRTQPIPITLQAGVQPPISSHKPPTMTRPIGPRELPTVPTTKPSLQESRVDLHIPTMPKPPDAIYSPAGDSAATINLPSSVSRTALYMSGAKNDSAPPVSTAPPTPLVVNSMQDYFTPAHKADQDGILSLTRKRMDHNFANDTQISAETLFDLSKKGVQILLVDIRDRGDFDSGHIMSQSIICIEPLSLRDGMSAEELGNSNSISPDAEQRLFENRDKFDLVVFYDECSTSIATSNKKAKLDQFSKAVYDYGYDKKLMRRPMLLVGGLEACIDLLGPNALERSATLDGKLLKPARPLGRVTKPRDFRRNHLPRSSSVRQSRLFSKEEEKAWDDTINKDMNRDDEEESEEFTYARTTEDFLRKYPELPSIQESMVSSRPRASVDRQVQQFDSVPSPPARPAPALPRQRSSGISERGPSTAYTMSLADSISTKSPNAGLTGLDNYCAKTCYVNSVIQCLSATPPLRKYLIDEYRYPTNPRPPKKPDESGDNPPQLLTRNLANLLTILWSGNYDWVMPKTFLVSKLHPMHAPFIDR